MPLWLAFVGQCNLTEQQQAQIMPKRLAGEAALQLMDDHLAKQPWFVGEQITLADIALYPYTATSEAGGFALENFGHVCAWLRRVEAQPGFVPMG